MSQFPYLVRDSNTPSASLAPLLPLVLSTEQIVSALGLLDSGATVNVLPFSLGQKLGLDWNQQRHPVLLGGNLSSVEARGVALSVQVAEFAPVRLAFAWAQTDAVPLILGQVNFEVRPK